MRISSTAYPMTTPAAACDLTYQALIVALWVFIVLNFCTVVPNLIDPFNSYQSRRRIAATLRILEANRTTSALVGAAKD